MVYVSSLQEVPDGEAVASIEHFDAKFNFLLRRSGFYFYGPIVASKILARASLHEYAQRLGIKRVYKVRPQAFHCDTGLPH